MKKLDQQQKYIDQYLLQPNYCVVCQKPLDYSRRFNQTCSDICYRSLLSQKAAETPRWNIHRNQTSYAERFWEEVLTNNNILFSREVAIKKVDNIHCYFLDFKIEKGDKLIDLEIDGKQHEDLSRQISDIERDSYLTNQGYVVYRIKWNSINSIQGQQLMQEKINNFIEFYNNL